MSCTTQPVEVASSLPENATIFGMPLAYVREFARHRSRLKYGTMSIIVSTSDNDRFTVEESFQVKKPIIIQPS